MEGQSETCAQAPTFLRNPGTAGEAPKMDLRPGPVCVIAPTYA